MTDQTKTYAMFALVAVLIIGTGFVQSWNSALFILNMGLISAIMSLGVNLQWGIAGLLNVGIMGFVALGGLATVLISMPGDKEAWAAGGPSILLGLLIGAATIVGAIFASRRLAKGMARTLVTVAIMLAGFVLYRMTFIPAVQAVEAVNPATSGYLGGLGLPVLLAWPVGGLFAAGAAWVIGKTALGLRSDYLAIATLGISEIIIAILKNEDWMSRGVKNVIGIPWRVAFALQADGWYLRQDIIWHKPNPMPESVRDRCTKAHEYVFLMSKSPRYYYDADAVKEDAVKGAAGGWICGHLDHLRGPFRTVSFDLI